MICINVDPRRRERVIVAKFFSTNGATHTASSRNSQVTSVHLSSDHAFSTHSATRFDSLHRPSNGTSRVRGPAGPSPLDAILETCMLMLHASPQFGFGLIRFREAVVQNGVGVGYQGFLDPSSKSLVPQFLDQRGKGLHGGLCETHKASFAAPVSMRLRTWPRRMRRLMHSAW